MNIKSYSVVGLGKLGACVAVAIASKGFKVIAVDKNPNRVKAFNQKKAPIFEPHLSAMLKKHGSHIFATDDYERAVLNSDITFIVVPTPSLANGEFSLKYVMQATTKIAKAISEKSSYHIVVLASTVLPGSTAFIKTILEKQSGKRCGRNFGLCYNPEFIALSTVIRDFLNPDFILIGESDKKTGNILEDFYKKICENKPPVYRMNFINAELTKLALNSFITTKITFANMLAELTERLPGADVDVITGALGLDSRIGKRYLKGGLGYGGPCFPRDNAALVSVAKKIKVRADIPVATDRFNHHIVTRLFNLVYSRIKTNEVVGILGLSYKPLTNVIEESQGFLLAEKLIEANVKVILYDPLAMGNVKKIFGNKAIYSKSIKDMINSSDIIVIANPDPVFRKIRTTDFIQRRRPIVVIDCWRLLYKCLSGSLKVKYIPLGIGGL